MVALSIQEARMRRRLGVTLAVAVMLLAAAPGDADPRRTQAAVKLADARIVLFPPSVAVYEIGAGGQPALKPDWTEAARGHVASALEAAFAAGRATIVPYEAPEIAERRAAHIQVTKVHMLVAQTIVRHEYGDDKFRLPSMAGRFDWSVGPGAAVIREDSGDADYALFVEFIEGHTSGGRVAMNVAAAVLGGSIVTGAHTGVASLVDLRTGDVVWFHRNRQRGGDLRTPEAARRSVGALLQGLPF